MRLVTSASLAGLLLSSASTAGLLLAGGSPAGAATTTCSTVAACVMGANSNAGYGIEGTSKANDGVVGMTMQNATSLSTGKAGVAGYDDSNNKNAYDSGVYGTSAYGDGVQGKSTAGYGVLGTLLANLTQTPKAGVAGYDTTSGGHRTTNSGVYGKASDLGNGVQGISANGIGVFGIATTASGIGAYAWNTSTSGGVGLLANVAHGTAIAALAPAGDALLRGYDGSNETASLSGAGDFTLAGTLTTNGNPEFRTTDSAGARVTTFGARSTTATLEDTGEATLTNGASYVRLDPEFARTIDHRSKYLVLITPEGNSHGLYTSGASAQGFSVRENDGGRSSVAFAYRIVARPLDDSRRLRLPPVALSPHQLGPQIAVPQAIGVDAAAPPKR
jgi:hypothetical protein